MPTNANTFNSRVTSEALEAKFRQVFPAQGGAELVQDLFASGVIQPVVDFSSVAEGSVLPANLQTAWDFSTGHTTTTSGNATLITNTGFWRVDLNVNQPSASAGTAKETKLTISDGLSSKVVWELNSQQTASTNVFHQIVSETFVVFLRSGDSLVLDTDGTTDVWYRQIADVNGTLVNPLGFTFS